MIQILYSHKKDEILIQKQDTVMDFADEKWNRKNKYFKAIFGRCVVIAKLKSKKKNKNIKSKSI